MMLSRRDKQKIPIFDTSNVHHHEGSTTSAMSNSQPIEINQTLVILIPAEHWHIDRYRCWEREKEVHPSQSSLQTIHFFDTLVENQRNRDFEEIML